MEKLEETSNRQIIDQSTTVETNSTVEVAEEGESVLRTRFASEVGGRKNQRLSKLFDRVGGWFGFGEKREAAVNKDGSAILPLPGERKTKLGRGGWTAVAILLVTLPLLALSLAWAVDLNSQAQGYKSNLEKIEKGSLGNEREGEFVNILSSPKLQIFDLQTTDARPVGSVKLYAADYKQWAFTYGGLIPTDQNNVYTIWVVRLPANGGQPGPNDYYNLTSFVNQANGGGNFLTISEGGFPNNFAYGNYNRLIITEEPGAKGQLVQPTGPVRFALDLSKVKLF